MSIFSEQNAVLHPVKPSVHILTETAVFQWNIQSTYRGMTGNRLANAAGQSTDFLDHKRYVAGDDVRRIDWTATARTDQLLVKRFQEENRPSVTLWVDDSLSMKLSAEKQQRLVDGVAWIAQSLQSLEAKVERLAFHAGPLAWEQVAVGDWQCMGQGSLAEGCKQWLGRLARGTHLILLSDLLSEHIPAEVVKALRSRVAGCTVIQLLAREDVEIPVGTQLELVDSETGEKMLVSLDTKAIADYHKRLEQLQADWEQSLVGIGGLFVLRPEMQWSDLCRQLLERGVLSVP